MNKLWTIQGERGKSASKHPLAHSSKSKKDNMVWRCPHQDNKLSNLLASKECLLKLGPE